MQFNLNYPQPRSDLYLEDFPISYGAFAGERWDEEKELTPASSIGRMLDQGELHMRDETGELDPLSVGTSGVDVPSAGKPNLTYISQEDARTRAAVSGFPGLSFPEEGTTREYTDWLIRRQQIQARRKSIRARTPDNLSYTATGFVLSFLANFADPVNIAASLIVPAGSVGRMTGGAFARAGTRFKAGALGGAAESILTEPIIYAQQQSEQLDYTLYDSLANIGFGALAGGSFRTVGGAAADFYRGRAQSQTINPPSATTQLAEAIATPTRSSEDLLLANIRKTDQDNIRKTALAQFFNDHPVHIDPLVDHLALRSYGENGIDPSSVARPTDPEILEKFRQEQFRIAEQMDLTNQNEITVSQRAVNEAMTEIKNIEASREPRLAGKSRNQKKAINKKIEKELEMARGKAERAEAAALSSSSIKKVLKEDHMMKEGRIPDNLRKAYQDFHAEEIRSWQRMRDIADKRGQITPISMAVRKGIDEIDSNDKIDIATDPSSARSNVTKIEALPDDNNLFQDIEDLEAEIKQTAPDVDIEAELRAADPDYRDKTTIADSMKRLAACL